VNLEQFVDQIKKDSTIKILENYKVNPHLVSSFKELKNFVKYINFDCQFDGLGCKEHPTILKCCCVDCRKSYGYFRILLNSDLKYYARHFNTKTGFWRKEKGCILPHKMRSVTCLTYHCNNSYFDSYKQSFEGFSRGINLIKNELYKYQKRIEKFPEKNRRKK